MSGASLDEFTRIGRLDHGLIVLATLRPDHSVQASVVNAGVLRHPVSRHEVVGIVAAGGSRKLANLRGKPRATAVVRAGWEWLAVEGDVDLVGPDDPLAGVDAEALRILRREVFVAAGGTHDDWEGYDRVMAEERRTVVLIAPDRVYGNAGS